MRKAPQNQQQLELEHVHDDIWAALRGLVSACGGSKRVGPQIWPAKPKADQWLDDCLNPDRQAKLCLEEFLQLLRIGRASGFHGAKYFVDDATFYARSKPIEVEDELASLLRAYLHSEQQQTKTKARLDELIALIRSRGVR